MSKDKQKATALSLTEAIVSWYRSWRRIRSIKKIRKEMTFWGYDISDMSDNEVEEGVLRISKVAVQCGISSINGL